MRYWKPLKIHKPEKIRIVAASYFNNDKKRFCASKCFINSILNQTYDIFELFIVHDGPIDRTEEAEDFIASIKDPRIKLFETEKREGKYGYPHRKKYAFLNEDFDWLIFTNDDNYYVPVALETFLHGCQKLDKKIIYSNMLSSHKFWFPLITDFQKEKLDLGGFMIHKDIMRDYNFVLSENNCFVADGLLINQLRLDHSDKIVKLDNFLYIHN